MNREVFDRTIPDGRCDEPPPSRNRSPGSLPPMAASEGRNPRIRRAADVPPFMTQEYDGRGGWVALAQFAQHWNRHPESREWMKTTPLPEDTGPRRGALIAALVHALCLRDGIPVPKWVLEWRHPTPVGVASSGSADTPFGRSVRSHASGVCDFHRAYFDVSFRDKP